MYCGRSTNMYSFVTNNLKAWKSANKFTNSHARILYMRSRSYCVTNPSLAQSFFEERKKFLFSFPRFLMDSGGSRRNGRSFGLGWPRARESVHLDKCPRDTIDRYARRLRFMRYSALTVYYSWSAFDNEKHRTVYFRVDNRARYNINCSPLFFLTSDKK